MRRQNFRNLWLLVALQLAFAGCGDGERRVPSRQKGTGGAENAGSDSGGAEQGGTENGGAENGGAAIAGGDPGGSSGLPSNAGAAGVAGKTATLVTDGTLSTDRASNPLGIEGSWTVATGTGSTGTLVLDGKRMCLSGSTAQVPLIEGTNYDYTHYFGATLSLDLCHSSAAADPPDVVYTLGGCPWAKELVKSLAGIRFTIAEGATMPRELRVIWKERGRATSAYAVASAPGQFTALVADATVANDSGAPPVQLANLEAIQIQAFPSRRAAVPYSFCIGSIEILTGSGWNALPDWIREPGPGMKTELAGVNLAGAEFGQQNLPGVYGTDYIYPSHADIDIYANYRMNVIRLPFRWERLQRTLDSEFDAAELSRLKATVQYANDRGMAVILDPHNFGRYGTSVIGTDVKFESFADFWGRLAAVYAQNDRVIFGLMNEPHDMPSTESWLEATNAAIAAIRATGAQNLVLVPGNGWTGAHSWASNWYGTPNGQVMLGVIDNAQNYAFELHQYLDSDSSGTHAACVSESIGVERVQQVTDWLRTNQVRGFLGEFNGGANETCYRAIDNLVAYIGQNADVWLGWAVWAGGPWWGENILTVHPKNGQDRPQMLVLERHLPAP